jgi:hypothetical protein
MRFTQPFFRRLSIISVGIDPTLSIKPSGVIYPRTRRRYRMKSSSAGITNASSDDAVSLVVSSSGTAAKVNGTFSTDTRPDASSA